jgi:hypothetical protein
MAEQEVLIEGLLAGVNLRSAPSQQGAAQLRERPLVITCDPAHESQRSRRAGLLPPPGVVPSRGGGMGQAPAQSRAGR